MNEKKVKVLINIELEMEGEENVKEIENATPFELDSLNSTLKDEFADFITDYDKELKIIKLNVKTGVVDPKEEAKIKNIFKEIFSGLANKDDGEDE